MIVIDGHDNAFIGMSCIDKGGKEFDVAVYSGEKLVDNLMAQGMSEHEAIEYVAFNIEGAYVGDETPVIVWNFNLEEAKELYI